MSGNPIRIIVFDDQEVVRVGLRLFFSAQGEEVVAEDSKGDSLLRLYRTFTPDLVISEVRLGNMFMFEPLEELSKEFPQVRTVLFSGSENPTHLALASLSGVSDYAFKTAPLTELLDRMRWAVESESVPHDRSRLNSVTSVMKSRAVTERHDLPLTGRELQILRHLAFGLSNREIARSLGLSVETVKEHVQNILRKTALKDRTQAAVWAVRKRLV